MIQKSNELIDAIVNAKRVYLYGAGEVGMAAAMYLSECYPTDKIAGFIKTEKAPEETELLGLPVFSVNDRLLAAGDNTAMDEEALIIIAAKSIHHSGILSALQNFSQDRIETMSDSFCQWLIERTSDRRIREPVDKSALYDLEKKFLKFVPKPCLEYMVLNIVDHCNLRCMGCDHFACIAEPYLVPYERIYRDLERMSEILKASNVIKMGVMGGEPLLHPDLPRILSAVRQFFPDVIIRLTTNGLLLLKQGEEFWRACRENGVVIVNTKYPIPQDYEGMKRKAGEEKVGFTFFEDTGDGIVKKSFKKVIDLNGENDPVRSFFECHIANYGNFLMEGRFYGCPFSCQACRIFNKKFGRNLKLSEGDYLDIYKVRDMRELFEFAAKPRYFCRYCSGLHRELNWERSSQDISEWIE